MFFSVFGFGSLYGQTKDGRPEKPVRVVTSFYPVYIMALNVIKDVPGVSVDNLTPPVTGCLHDYSLTADDMKKISDADIFIGQGAGMESFIEKIRSQYPGLKMVRLAEGLHLIQSVEQVNPHVWVSISGAIEEVRNLGAAMEKLDPGRAGLYRKNTGEYLLKLEALRARMKSALAAYRGTRIVTFHEAFPYFAAEFGLEIAAVVEREPGSSPSAKEAVETVDRIKKNRVRILFTEPQYPPQAADMIARETGAKVYVLDPAVTGPEDPDAYLRIMEKNLETLKKAMAETGEAEK